jgi:hypothetical protein
MTQAPGHFSEDCMDNGFIKSDWFFPNLFDYSYKTYIGVEKSNAMFAERKVRYLALFTY